MSKLSPIVIFTYNRPWHTRQTVEALQKNELAQQSDLIIYSDAPKDSMVTDEVQQVRDYLKTISGFKSIRIFEKEENWGLAKSIISGVTEIVNIYGKVIVLEDDMITSPYFLNYMNDALNRYESYERVFGITGFAYPVDYHNLPNAYFMKDEGCWGWATWNRAWKFFEKDTNNLINTFTPNMIKEFNFDDTNNFWTQVLLNQQGKINTWAIYWYATVFLNDGLFLHPKETFIKNIGHDGSGVHCDKTNEFDSPFIQKYDIIFPEKLEICNIARNAHKRYFRSQTGFVNRMRKKLSSLVGF
ncbi:glycosyltransferase [Acinetobacter sp. VNH17]|uniref:Glycosyltransferase n=1 Tax=Acinetobacter thutiue TaxID=2998078 RepID=A0ABT7WPA8_9GAMM|nr:glycosyltransferase [Acinetobacter thutiue]MCY6412413.1 glycosyltransferase [Acinetobacter thutiue]MDN0014518.1 glycosyltransferase [Acinetobacter thutiue]